MNLGPIALSTVVCKDIDSSIHFYRKFGARVDLRYVLGEQQRAQLFAEAKITNSALVTSESNNHIARLIEVPSAQTSPCLRHRGWMALEIATNAVDYLGNYLKHDNIHGEPQYLDFSDKIKAMQIEGFANEMLYLTQVKDAVPPFDLPLPHAVFDGIFIVVLSSKDREFSANFYQELGGNSPLLSETKITVVNKAFNIDGQTKHPIAIVQLYDQSLIEIDQIDMAVSYESDALTTGIRAVSFFHDSVDIISSNYNVNIYQDSVYSKNACTIQGPDGEQIELIERQQLERQQ